MAKKSRKQELIERIEKRIAELEDLMLWIPPDENYDKLFKNCRQEAEALIKELDTLKQI